MSACQMFLTAMRRTADASAVKAEKSAAVLGDAFIGYTVELHDGRQIEVGREHCKYCARVEAIQQLCAEAEAKADLVQS
jgi:hypothetical protein